MRLEGKTAVITGSASGIGRATMELFAREGATVVGVDTSQKTNDELVNALKDAGFPAWSYVADVTDEQQVASVVEAVGGHAASVDILVNNAGGSRGGGARPWMSGPLETCSIQDWSRTIEVNLTSHFLVTKLFLPLMKRSGRGSIVHLSSVNAFAGNPLIPAYSAAKGGVLPLTYVMAYEFAKYGIRVNAVCPGTITSGASAARSEEYKQAQERVVPLGRFGTSIELANSILWFASDDSSYVTGTYMPVDGGRTAIAPGTTFQTD